MPKLFKSSELLTKVIGTWARLVTKVDTDHFLNSKFKTQSSCMFKFQCCFSMVIYPDFTMANIIGPAELARLVLCVWPHMYSTENKKQSELMPQPSFDPISHLN